MKTVASILLSLVLISFLLLALPVSGEEALYDSVLRLHVLPASDSAEDQNLKIAVRDAVLEKYGEALATVKSKTEAEALLSERRGEIEEFVNAFLKKKHIEQHATVTLEREYFDTRAYGEITLPAGFYSALKITLGEGEGQNWWCVLYPSLCTEAAMGERVNIAKEQLSESEYRLVTDSGYLVKFRTLEILNGIFGK